MGKVKQVTGIDVAAPVKVVQSGIKAIQNAPVISSISDAATKVLQPVEKAVVQPIGQGLVSLDKAVGNAIPGGWGTLGTVAASMIPGGQFAALGLGKTAAMTGLGALTGSGVLRPGRSFNLQGAVLGGAMAYGSSQLADYAAAAGGAPTVDTSGALSAPPTAGVPLVSEPPMGIMDSISKYAGDVGRNLTASPSNLVQEPGIMDSIANSFSNAGRNISSFADAATNPSTYTDFGKSYAQNVSDIGSGIKNLITTPGVGKAVTAATGINPVGAAGATLFGATGLMALNEQEKLLKEQLANQQIAQAEYDQALGEINRQRDYAAKTVKENPFKLDDTSNLRPDRTVYERTGPERNLYERSRGNLYAAGGSVDDELGGDYTAMGMDPGNLQKGLFGMGYAAGGQVDMGNGYNPFANLRTMSGPIGAVGQPSAAGFNPFKNYVTSSVNSTTMQDIMGGDRRPVNQQLTGDILSGLKSLFSGAQTALPQAAQQMPTGPIYNSSIDRYSGSSISSGPSSMGGYGGGNSGAFPLEGKYGIVKMASGGMAPRFLSGGGDGMSDSIPASIEGKQEARLADGEFVIPADVVSHLGNGSSKAGAKRLYAMMDRVRQERTGTTKQGKQINPRKHMPA